MNWQSFKEKVLNNRDLNSPLVVWGGALIALILLYSFILEPFMLWRGERYIALDQMMKRTEKILAMQRVESQWKLSAVKYEHAADERKKGFLHNLTDASRQAELQKIIKGLVVQYGMSMNQVAFVGKKQEQGMLGSTGVRFKLVGEINDHLRFLHALALSDVILVVEDWSFFKRDSESLSNLLIQAYYIPSDQPQ